MSFDSMESSTASAVPYELYWITLQPPNAPAQNWYLTSGDVARTDASNNVYVPATIRRTEVRQDNEMRSGSIQIYLPIDHPVSQLFVQGAPPAPMGLVVYAGHDGDAETAVVFHGRVQSARGTIECELTCLPSQQATKKRGPTSVYQSQCNRVLYSAECGVPAGGFPSCQNPTRFVASVTSISADGKTIGVQFGAFDTNWWNFNFAAMDSNSATLAWGYLTTSAGRTMMIVGHSVVGVIQLKAPVPGMAVGDAVTLNRGCGRTWKSCMSFFVMNDGTFAENPRMLGFEFMPQKNPFSEGLA